MQTQIANPATASLIVGHQSVHLGLGRVKAYFGYQFVALLFCQFGLETTRSNYHRQTGTILLTPAVVIMFTLTVICAVVAIYLAFRAIGPLLKAAQNFNACNVNMSTLGLKIVYFLTAANWLTFVCLFVITSTIGQVQHRNLISEATYFAFFLLIMVQVLQVPIISKFMTRFTDILSDPNLEKQLKRTHTFTSCIVYPSIFALTIGLAAPETCCYRVLFLFFIWPFVMISLVKSINLLRTHIDTFISDLIYQDELETEEAMYDDHEKF